MKCDGEVTTKKVLLLNKGVETVSKETYTYREIMEYR